jgi:hypothetical protein
MATLFMASGNYSPGITDVDYDRWALDNHEPSEGYEPAEETDAGDDYPMSDEGWIKCHHCGGSGLGIEGRDCD